MIETVPQEWQSIQATVGEEAEIPADAACVTILPIEDGSEEVTISFFVPKLVDSEVESRPVVTGTLERGEESRHIHERYLTLVPSPSEDSITIYALGRTEEERRTLW